MCRRICGAVDSFLSNAHSGGLPINGRHTQVLIAIAKGGWQPTEPDVATAEAILQRGLVVSNHWWRSLIEGDRWNAQAGTGGYQIVQQVTIAVNARWNPGKRNRRTRGIGY